MPIVVVMTDSSCTGNSDCGANNKLQPPESHPLEFAIDTPGEAKEDEVDVEYQNGTDTTTGTSSTDRPSVQFSDITIREYPIVLGDNPGGRKGPPLSIAWRHDNEVTVEVEKFERLRPNRRTKEEMIMPEHVRTDRLRQAGYSKLEIMRLTKPVNVARAQRRRTNETLHLEGLQHFTESFGRKAKNIMSFGKNKRQEKQLLRSSSSLDLTRSTVVSLEEGSPATDEESESRDPDLSDSSEVCV